MTVLGTQVLDKAMKDHADLRGSGAAWLKIARAEKWASLVELRKTWPASDPAGDETVFNIKGNSYRLSALVNYEAQTIIITKVETHAEYTKRLRQGKKG